MARYVSRHFPEQLCTALSHRLLCGFNHQKVTANVDKISRTLANHSLRIMWGPEKGRTDIEKGVVLSCRLGARIPQSVMTECD